MSTTIAGAARANSIAAAVVPTNLIMVNNGQVVLVDHWLVLNGEAVRDTRVGRELDPEVREKSGDFYMEVNDPTCIRHSFYHGFRRGSLETVLKWGQHGSFLPQYTELFGLPDADEKSVRRIEAFEDYEVKIIV